jgi:hypothetical protein
METKAFQDFLYFFAVFRICIQWIPQIRIILAQRLNAIHRFGYFCAWGVVVMEFCSCLGKF